MNPLDRLPPSPRAARRSMALLVLLSAATTLAQAQVTDWEFFVPRDREYSVTRKQADTMALSFGGRSVELRRAWSLLSDEDRAAVRSIQPSLADGDEPPYPKQGLKPLIERLHRVRGPAGQDLRIQLEVDHLGAVTAVGAGQPVSDEFLGQMVALMVNSAFKPGTCGGKPCTRVFAFDMRYVGD